MIFRILIIFFFGLTLSSPGPCHGAESQMKIPASVGIILNKAAILSSQDKNQEALDVLVRFNAKKEGVNAKKAQSKGYTHPYIYFSMGNCQLMMGKTNEAAASYRNALKGAPQFSEAWLNLGKCLYDLEKMEDAGKAFLKGYESQQQPEPLFLFYCAACYASAGKWDRSYGLFQRLLRNHPQGIKLEWKETLVQVLLTLEKNKEALPFIVELSEKTTGKKQRQWREIRLYQYMAMGMEDKALSYARHLTGVDTVEPTWWKALAHLYMQKNRYKEGLSAFLAYSFLVPLSEQETELMADLHMAVGVPAQAATYYETLLKDHIDPDVLKKLVQADMQVYDRDKALSLLDTAEKERGSSLPCDLAMLKGELLFEEGLYDKAFSVFEKLGKNDKTKGRAFLMMGYCAWNINDTNEARSAFKKAAEFAPLKKEAEKALKQLSKS